MYAPRSPKGFTLIELLVVIAIIGILSAVILVSVTTARTRALDNARIASARQIQRALELYYADNGKYPNAGGSGYFGAYPYLTTACGYDGAWCRLETTLASYIQKLPRDTNGSFSGMGAANIRWIYKNVQHAPDLYALGVWLDAPNSTAANDGGVHAQVYEIGPAIEYCKNTYPSAPSAWIWSGIVCAGGN